MRGLLLIVLSLSLLSLTAARFTFPDCQSAPLLNTPVCDRSLPYVERATWLVQQMNVSEKVAQLINSNPGAPRLGLPSYEWWTEALHGVATSPGVSFTQSGPYSCATSFPAPIGLGATFDRYLIQAVSGAIATEGRAFSNVGRSSLDFWSPNINLFRDPRWGRGQETPGEDPYHLSEYVYYLIRGYQEGEDRRYNKIVANCKHFAGYDVEDWHGHDRYDYDAKISMQDLVETYLPPFKSCMKDAQVGSAMCSYNSLNGVPTCCNAFLMNELARERWGWDGYMVSDCNAVGNIIVNHHYVNTTNQLVQVTLRAGLDLGCDTSLAAHGVEAYNAGFINDTDLDRALTRLYSSLVRSGYFDPANDQPYRNYGPAVINSTAIRQLALRATRESYVLLKNEGRTLPFDSSKTLTVAVIGPNIDNARVQVSSYEGIPCALSTPLSALRGLSNVKVISAHGVDVNSTNTSGIAAAVQAAQAADVIVYVGGLSQQVEAEGHDRNTIDLPGQQLNLLMQLEKVGKPLVVVLFGAGGMDISYLKNSSATGAVLWAGYPSQMGGEALADVLFGRYSPSGRLPVTWYPLDYVDQVSMIDQSMRASATNPGRTYKFYTGQSVFPFGYGLSYSTFSYQTTAAVRPVYRIAELIGRARADDKQADVALTINVTNTGSVASDVSVLAFVSSNVSVGGVSPPLKELFDYQRVMMMAPGSSEVITFGLSYRVLGHVDAYGHQWLLPGVYRVAVQNEEEVVHTFVLEGEPALVEDFPHPNNPAPVTPTMSEYAKPTRVSME